SSRRRHTRWPRDWSSDVCSSDLAATTVAAAGSIQADQVAFQDHAARLGRAFTELQQAIDAAESQRAITAAQARELRALFGYAERSEERRVGKEGKARWAAEQ